MACALAASSCRPSLASSPRRSLATFANVQPIASRLQAPGHGHRRHRRRPSPTAAAHRLVVCTSEHWWEDEDEFDALTDAMHPKCIALVASNGSADEAALQQLRAYLHPLEFAQGFSADETVDFARQLWSGRDKAPYFLKVRSRAALDACASGGAGAAAAAASVWQELLQQNWRVQLDAGLGSAAPESEALLLVCTPEAVRQLLAAAGAPSTSGSSGSSAAGAVWVLQVDGTQAGESLDWQLLSKRLLLDGAAPSGGDTVAAALSPAGAAAPAQ